MTESKYDYDIDRPQYSISYEPLGSLAETTQLDEDLTSGFMHASKMRAWILITDPETQRLHELDKGLEQLFGVPPGSGISTFKEEDIIYQIPGFILARNTMDPHQYTVYLAEKKDQRDDKTYLGVLNRSLKSALRQILRQEKLTFLSKFSTYDMGYFRIRALESGPSVDPLHYIAGRLFLARHGNHLIVPKQITTP